MVRWLWRAVVLLMAMSGLSLLVIAAPARAGPSAAGLGPSAGLGPATGESTPPTSTSTTTSRPPAVTAPSTTATTAPVVSVARLVQPLTTRVTSPSPTTAPPSTVAAPAGYPGKWGIFASDFPGSMDTVKSLQSETGRTADYVMWYEGWTGSYNGFDAAEFQQVLANGSTPIITWMSGSPSDPISDASIAAGEYDSYIRSWADGLKSLGQPVILRFDHEMNGNWYSWSPGQDGNTAASFVAAWRHVYDVFAAAGASNVIFLWTPNVDYAGETSMASVYPGDAYVGMVGLDGYNWGDESGHSWQTPAQVFDQSLKELAAITDKPVLLGEVGSSSVGGDKAEWINQFFALLEADRSVTGFVWFDYDQETDWEINSSPQSLAAFVADVKG